MISEQQLYDKIVTANREYRNGTPIMSDSEYDRLIEELRNINPEHPWLRQVEPGIDVPDRKVKLPHPMRSLDKVKTFDELMEWFKKTGIMKHEDVVIAPKYDGISLLLNEKTGMAYTRGGNDNEGMNCMAHVLCMPSVKRPSSTKLGYSFGEAIISKENWRKRFEGKVSKSGLPYKSARNTVAGLFRRDIPDKDELSYVSFVRYGAFDYPSDRFPTYASLLRYMRTQHGEASFFNISCVTNLTERRLEYLFNFWSERFNIDGLVMYVNDMCRWDSLGRDSSSGNPKWAIAYKPESFTSSEITTVLSVNCKVSKSGALKPTVKVDAVELEGATIDNPTGYNARFCVNEGIGKGATIKIIRSGMVIPKIVNVISPVSREKALEPFKICPACGCLTVWGKNDVDVYCSNSDCSGKRLARLVHFCEKLEYENIGEETLRSLFNSGITTPRKLIRADKSMLRKIDGIGEDTAERIINRNRELYDKGVSLPNLMEASCVFEGIGEKKAKILCQAIGEKRFTQWLTNTLLVEDRATISMDLTLAPGIGSVIADRFMQNMDEFIAFARDLNLGIDNSVFNENKDGKLVGMKVCFSGIRDKELEKIIEDNGGMVVNSVSKLLSYLIVKDPNQSSSKLTKAKAFSVPVMTIEEFRKELSL